MASEFKLSVLTPERTVFEGSVEYVQVPGSQGYLGVLAHHAALVTALAPGTMTVREAGGREQHWQVSGGFFEVSNNQATVLADSVGALCAFLNLPEGARRRAIVSLAHCAPSPTRWGRSPAAPLPPHCSFELHALQLA